jgi:hypothetical protein
VHQCMVEELDDPVMNSRPSRIGRLEHQKRIDEEVRVLMELRVEPVIGRRPRGASSLWARRERTQAEIRSRGRFRRDHQQPMPSSPPVRVHRTPHRRTVRVRVGHPSATSPLRESRRRCRPGRRARHRPRHQALSQDCSTPPEPHGSRRRNPPKLTASPIPEPDPTLKTR